SAGSVFSPSGLGFNLVSRNEHLSSLSNNTRYDMLALSQRFDIGLQDSLMVQYGIARLDGDGEGRGAGDNGIVGGYSQFLGLSHMTPVGETLRWQSSLRYDNHQVDARRTVSYGSTHKVAASQNTLQSLEMRSDLSRPVTLNSDVTLTPSLGMKMRHARDAGLKERGAGDFNLTLDGARETAVQAVAGVNLSWADASGWGASLNLEGGPDLSRTERQRKGSLQGAAGERFTVTGDKNAQGMNGMAQAGVSYDSGLQKLSLDAYQWKDGQVSDSGLELKLKVRF
ncbi:autotransporter outer membrane beta-barrel domain-containing protein, partial [Enterobacter asburiae]|nr:autotransporter domain-containing protein [Enterobacter asburiae]